MSWRQWSAVVRFGGAGVVLGLVLAGAFGAPSGLRAQAASPAVGDRIRPSGGPLTAESNGTLAMIAPLGAGSQGATGQLLYLVDTKTRSFAVYRIDPAHDGGTIELKGVRQYQWDLMLSEYNNQGPKVAETKSAVSGVSAQNR